MKIILACLTLLMFSNCRLISIFKIQDALKQERMAQYAFKREIPFRFENGLILVPVKLNGSVETFIFDTGASTIIDVNLAKRLNYKKIGTRKHIDSGDKKKILKTIKLDKITVAGIDYTSIIADIYDLERLKNETCLEFSGILGSNVMNKAIWQIDYKNQKIIVTDSKDSLAFAADKKKMGFYLVGNSTPKIRLSSDKQYLDEGELDTGSSGGFSFSKKHLKCLSVLNKTVKKYGISTGIFGKTIDTATIVKVPNFTLGDSFTLKNTVISASTGLSLSLIGNDFLKNYIVTIDWKYQEVTFSSFHTSTENAFYGFGFSPRFKDGKLIMGSIWENSPATKVGLELNDHILQINDVDFRNATHNDYCHLFQHHIIGNSHEITLIVKKHDKEVKYVLMKTNLIENLDLKPYIKI